MNIIINLFILSLFLFEIETETSEPAGPRNSDTICKDANAIGSYKAGDDKTCTKFVVCYAIGDKFKGLLKTCPSGQYFHPEKKICSADYENCIDGEVDDGNHEWDLLVFSQQWPVTTCYQWREQDKNHKCKIPSTKEFWTIHGLWPTKYGQMGPSFCNKTAQFDINQLETIEDRLNQFWPDLDGESNGDWLWQHEWLKHGTCAATLEQLNKEKKYFAQSLTWREGYVISNILGNSGIHPDSNNTVVALNTALVKGLGKNPSIHCLYDSKTDISYLAEIRICFDKDLNATDCDGVKHGDVVSIDYPGGTVITNCHISKPVHYPSLVPNR